MLYFTGFVLAEAQRVGSVMAALQWGFLIVLPSHILLAGIKFWWYRRQLVKKVTNALCERAAPGDICRKWRNISARK